MDEFLGQNTPGNEKNTETTQTENQGFNNSQYSTSPNVNYQQNAYGQNGFGQNNTYPTSPNAYILTINLMGNKHILPQIHKQLTLHKPLKIL